MVIIYRMSGLTYTMARSFVKVSSYGMVNLIAGRSIVPELIQNDCTPERIAAEAVSLLTDDGRSAVMRSDLEDVRAKLGGPGASEHAALAILAAGARA
jgi:lipid-A-disaccharide synthase